MVTAELLSNVRPLTVAEFDRMVELGLFHEDERIELIDGVLVRMSPQNPKHAAACSRVRRMLSALEASSEAFVREEKPVILSATSEVCPDVSVLRPAKHEYAQRHPRPRDVLLVVEVSDTTIESDRSIKLPKYAAAGICEVWLIDIKGRAFEVFSDPVPRTGRYRECHVHGLGEVVSPASFHRCRIAVSDILGDL